MNIVFAGENKLKRKHKSIEDEAVRKENQKDTQKCVVQEGFSWWTCLVNGIPLEQSKPHAVPKNNSS